MLALLLGFLALARHLELSDRASLGYGAPRRVFVRELGIALADAVEGKVEMGVQQRPGRIGKQRHRRQCQHHQPEKPRECTHR